MTLTIATLGQPGWSASKWDSYVPPEMIYADDLKQTVTLPTKLNLNTVALNQIQILPGFDDDLALKVFRNRPYEGIQDFYRKVKGPDQKRMNRLLQQIEPKITFK